MRQQVHRPLKLSARKLTAIIAIFTAVLLLVLTLPGDLFKDTPYSTVVLSNEGELLGARIAADGQWRFPPSGHVPEKYERAVIRFEDRYFRRHPGVNPLSIIRAAKQNAKAGHTVSGGSTITMQVIRLSHPRKRNISSKIAEALEAVRLEASCSKDKILALYAAHAPFGGNVVGLEAACWRYYGHSADDVSWAEAATLAVLPNSPSYIHVSRNREKLLSKRNRLLAELHDEGLMDANDYALAISEPLPDEPLPLPSLARSTVDKIAMEMPGTIVRTDIRYELQCRLEELADRWNLSLASQDIADLSAIIIDVKTGNTIASVGNANSSDSRPGSQLDISTSPRSTGSLLKPFLYCAMLQDGQILPHTLLPDIPVNINGFSPHNFDRTFCGAVPASEAVARSLNVPAVNMLRDYGIPKFYELLKELGMTTLSFSASHYGLSLILGGAEGKLSEITTAYAEMAARYQEYSWADKCPLNDKVALYWTLDALKDVSRPDEMDWRIIPSVQKIAWKTGTSYGFRDAWAIGVTADYVVGVWAGNADGSGVSGLIGARTAGPIMFDIMNMLPECEWFTGPQSVDGLELSVCRSGGHLSGPYCEECDTLLLPKNAVRSAVCPYHKRLQDGSNAFLLPPAMGWYYSKKNPGTIHHTESRADDYCPMQFIYPENGSVISIPRQLDGSIKGAAFSLAHSIPDTRVFWHLDDRYLGVTENIHQMVIAADPGQHNVTVVDSQGNSLSISFVIS